jgi:cobalt transporter subunit CbtB
MAASRHRAVPRSHETSASERLQAGLLAVLLGAFVLFGTGFAQSRVLHDAAHDARHGFTFPCH